MHDRSILSNKFGQTIVIFVSFTALFALAYTQSPLYTSNQNQYFLQGLARAGLGYLDQDWLANTLEPTPVFSFLVEVTIRSTHSVSLFYIYYALLMGIYLFSLLGIGINLFGPTNEAHKNLFLLLLAGVLIVLHSAALRFILSRIVGVNWTYLFEDGVADQRILGPVFQPSTFGVLLISSIYLFVKNKPYQATLFAAFAAIFHPTYLPSAAVLTLMYMFLTWKNERNKTRVISIGILALISVAPILYYVIISFGDKSIEMVTQAREILVNYRIPHHARVDQWLDSTVAVKMLLILAALYLTRRSGSVFTILLGSSLIAGLLTVVQILLDSNFLALLFPWRLSIFILPSSTMLVVAAIAAWICSSSLSSTSTRVKFLKFVCGAAIMLTVLIGIVRIKLDFSRKIHDPQQMLFSFVNIHKQPGDLYLTPVKMQDFRLASGAPAYVDFKSIPYKDTDVLEWYRRVRLADDFFKSNDCDLLSNLVSEDKVTHVVLEMDQVSSLCPTTEIVYQDQNFSLLHINEQ